VILEVPAPEGGCVTAINGEALGLAVVALCSTIYIDTAEYYIGSVDKILGILLSTAEVEPVSVF
ncbi:MAG: hypothetical protein F6K09_28165, partial [Merismopedia sp. SIO2A8]|nr:hypothetical protein [Merismopedia sp. SIO2A8]